MHLHICCCEHLCVLLVTALLSHPRPPRHVGHRCAVGGLPEPTSVTSHPRGRQSANSCGWCCVVKWSCEVEWACSLVTGTTSVRWWERVFPPAPPRSSHRAVTCAPDLSISCSRPLVAIGGLLAVISSPLLSQSHYPLGHGEDLSWRQRSYHGMASDIKLTCGDPSEFGNASLNGSRLSSLGNWIVQSLSSV